MFGRIRLDSAVRALAYLDRNKSEIAEPPTKTKGPDPSLTAKKSAPALTLLKKKA